MPYVSTQPDFWHPEGSKVHLPLDNLSLEQIMALPLSAFSSNEIASIYVMQEDLDYYEDEILEALFNNDPVAKERVKKAADYLIGMIDMSNMGNDFWLEYAGEYPLQFASEDGPKSVVANLKRTYTEDYDDLVDAFNSELDTRTIDRILGELLSGRDNDSYLDIDIVMNSNSSMGLYQFCEEEYEVEIDMSEIDTDNMTEFEYGKIIEAVDEATYNDAIEREDFDERYIHKSAYGVDFCVYATPNFDKIKEYIEDRLEDILEEQQRREAQEFIKKFKYIKFT